MRSLFGRTDIDVEAVRTAVGRVVDPEIHRPLAELGMLDRVDADRSGQVVIRALLTTAGCPMQAELRSAIETAARSVPGVWAVEVVFTAMAQSQRTQLARSLRDPGGGVRGTGSSTCVFAVASGKGGVGKSAVTANLAAAFAAQGRTVGILDADVWGYSMPQLFGVRRPPVALNGMMMPIQTHGVRLMSTGFFVQDEEPVVWRGPMLHKALEQFLDDVYWGNLDILFIDLPPGTGDITLSLVELVPNSALILVSTPQLAAHTVAARAARMAKDARVEVAGVVENMSAAVCGGCGDTTPVFGSGGGARLAQLLDVPLLGEIPLDLALRKSGDNGVPVVISDPHAPSAHAIQQIAARLPVTRPSIIGRSLPLHPGPVSQPHIRDEDRSNAGRSSVGSRVGRG
ncbi:Mrp/NBP35 family ATP-binding protein [Nocardia seriolae]|uniref:Iron-sulfur cluster carrier protein n=1 Tax=Nocardia seriolae TaxID=37332 RepID=A0ABC8AWB2_9NOCA|nr:Mrp/NBP35 family ATP-binding protein [Nocardia seriolae]APA98515.1 Iron-sulfur cluster carrier protein [Nocardia seriolae]OJF80524.1 sodium:proton antiporter [Nocardia seriolae]WKY55891.1 Mrp/NBP35 family ATP-binding protein [Nocardia seriolae]WNJ55885.1 Mrp/NBP35 family ATP-binding protein [Nocardia seriolae]BAW07106.1 sodium:proton antiporter [Nocardia seriolae]